MAKVYMAPLEGITGYVFRNAYHASVNADLDGYVTPFISPNQNCCMNKKERRDVAPENNVGMKVVPQILTKDAKRFVDTAWELKNMGYDQVNLNLGCPSPTVTTKKKGAGMLAEVSALAVFLEEIYADCPLPISIKTRIGIERKEEWPILLQLYSRYPVKELIIHPRTLRDFYGNTPHVSAVTLAKESCDIPLCYNGDIFSIEDYDRIREELGDINVMLGRGLLRNPSLAREIMNRLGKGQESTENNAPEDCKNIPVDGKNDTMALHDELLLRYQQVLSGDSQVLQKMKEFWTYHFMGREDAHKELKAIKKAKHMQEYLLAVQKLR